MNTQKIEALLDEIEFIIEDIRDELNGGSAPFPIPDDQLVWKNGNLWKPTSESDNRLVVLLRADWPRPDYVQALTDNDKWETLEYTGSDHNGNRHHYRGNLPGVGYRGRRKGGGVRVFYGEDYGYIPIPGPAKERHE